MTPIRVTIARRRADYFEAFHAILARRLLRFALLTLLVLVILDAARGWLRPPNHPRDVAALLLLEVAIAAVVWGVAYGTTVYLTAQRMYRTHLRVPGKTYTFDDSGVRYASATTASQTAWSAFASYRETPNLFLLFFPNRTFALISKRNVDDGRVDDLRTLLHARISK